MWKKWAVSLCLGMGFMPWASAQAAGPTIDEVWMQHGGARLYYDALMEPQQMNLKGARRKDPALMHNLPPIVEVKPQSTRRKRSTSAAAKPSATVQATAPPTTGLPAGQVVSPKPSVEAVAPASVKTNGSATMQTPPAPGSTGTGAAAGTGGGVNGAGKASPGSLLPAQSTRDVFVPPPASPAVPASQSAGMGAGATGSATGAGSATRTAGAGESTGAAASAPRPNIPAGARP